MRDFAIAVLICIVLSVIVVPFVEIVEIFREKILFSSAITNACRASKTMSISYFNKGNLDASIDEDILMEKFSDIFEETMSVIRKSKDNNIMVFESIDGKYNDICVEVNVYQKERDGSQIAKMHVKAESKYKYKTKYLKMLEKSSSTLTDHNFTVEQTYLLIIKN